MEKAYFMTELGVRIPVMYNPKDFEVTRATAWRDTPNTSKDAPAKQFLRGESDHLCLKIVVDTTGTGDAVTKHTDELLKLTEIDTSLPGHDDAKKNGRPQWVRFHWGRIATPQMVITSLNLKFTYFARNGKPLRAEASVALDQFDETPKLQAQNPVSGTPEPHRVHTVTPGETLDRIAAQHYGDPTPWRVIAAANNILDPLAITPGTLLRIPPRPEVHVG